MNKLLPVVLLLSTYASAQQAIIDPVQPAANIKDSLLQDSLAALSPAVTDSLLVNADALQITPVPWDWGMWPRSFDYRWDGTLVDWSKIFVPTSKGKPVDTNATTEKEPLAAIALPPEPERKPLKLKKVSESSAAIWYLSGGGVLAAGLLLFTFRRKPK